MKKAPLILIVLILLAAALVWILRCPRCTHPPSLEMSLPAGPAPAPAVAPTLPPEPTAPQGEPPAAHVAEQVPVDENPVTGMAQAPEAGEALPAAESPALAPEQALEALRVTFKNYGQRFKGNPVGNNAEITAALNGDNPQQVRFLGEMPALNEKGELVDGWGTPYFFHQLGGYDMEIHSAGPDRKMWTADDLVAQ